MALGFRHARGRLVEQQHPRAAGDGERDLQQPLLAVGHAGSALMHDIGEMKARQHVGGLFDQFRLAADRAPPRATGAAAFGNGEADAFQRRELAEQLVDLEGAGEAARHPPMRFESGDVLPVETDSAGARAQQPGQQIDQRGLAGAVRPDQRMASALLDPQ